jgi:NAD(P)-dependent dehydrogenase (short-subunit alcohol dehydrogenase family)
VPYAIALMRRLEQLAVLVTGATSGIGYAIARRCAAEGAQVLATGRDQARLDELVRLAAPDGAAESEGSITGFAADLSRPEAPDECVAAALTAFGRLDGVVHSAGVIRRKEDLRDTTDEQWAYAMSVNLDATFRLARASLRAMVRGGGSIVLIGSQLAHVAAPGYASYCASKGAVESLVRALAVDFGPSGVRVNALAPGVVATPLSYVDRPNFDEMIDGIAAGLPLRRIGQPDDMAGPAVFLLSADSAWMTGQSLVVDGGYTIQ